MPAFAGGLHVESSLGTLAIMNFQYSSICRGGNSIIEKIQAAGIDASSYVRFYNLRNYSDDDYDYLISYIVSKVVYGRKKLHWHVISDGVGLVQ